MIHSNGFPQKQGLYNPIDEKDSCGVGFITNIHGEKSHDIVKKGIEILINLTHRGSVGADTSTGDGAGILLQIPDEFFRIHCSNLGIELPNQGDYGVAMTFLPKETATKYQCEGIFERVVEEEGQKLLGWRHVPRDSTAIGDTAKGTEPIVRQLFIESTCDNQIEFERKLFIIRKRAESEVKRLVKRSSEYFHICSLSSRTIVYKGLLLADQIKQFYIDLNDINFKSAIALVHQRYSTNTFPTWDLAQPFRYLGHNGEINTIRGNRNWMNAREGILKSDIFKDELEKLFPIIEPNRSDSASLDNIFELLIADGRTIPHALMMLIPEAWENNTFLDKKIRDFYQCHGLLIEPWDGPAALAFSNGVQIGAMLDRNGLRPMRYTITDDDMAIVASEAGVLNVPPENIIENGRLKPGKILLIDTEQGRIIRDKEIKEMVCSDVYGDIIKNNKYTLIDFNGIVEEVKINPEALQEKQKAFGYTKEELISIIKYMANNAKEPLGSTGNDAPLAVLSERPQLLFSYFKQLFAQVTNPPIDPIREEMVTSLMNYIGSQENILTQNLKNSPYIEIKSPILTELEMAKIKGLRNDDFRTTTIPITFKYDLGTKAFKDELKLICERASQRIKEGYNIIVLSDKNVDSYETAIPSLLAVSALHHYLIREKSRTKISIIVETGEVRETMHAALLIGYGATAVNPYLAFQSIRHMVDNNDIKDINYGEAEKNYVDAINKGLLKIISKMGISTLRSYHGAQIFEALGLNEEFINEYFEGTASRIGGIGLDVVAEDTLKRHESAFNKLSKETYSLESGGSYNYRKNGEYHLFNPENVSMLQKACINNDYNLYKQYSSRINDGNEYCTNLRGLFDLEYKNEIPISEVEPISEIVKRFSTGAMSFGSLSKEAHESIAIAMNKLGGKSNSGEGGEDPRRYEREENGDYKRSAIKQIASGRFGVTCDYLTHADELEIKMAQGAKPGEGGQLPANKVDKEISSVRNSIPGIDLISPPPHHDIYSIEDLSQLILDLKCVNPSARINVKLVSEAGIGTVAAGVAKAHADSILISGYDGGTGASPLSSIKHAGLPWELGLSEVQQVLLLNNLRSRVILKVDGKLTTGKDVVIASLLGAEEFGFASSILISIGCIMCRKCHENICSRGIATQNCELREKFIGKPEYIINYLKFVAREVREIMAKLGFKTINEMVGRVDKIKQKRNVKNYKASRLDLSSILYRPDMPKRIKAYCVNPQEHGLEKSLDYKLIQYAKHALTKELNIKGSFQIKNTDRSVGAMISGIIAKKYGNEGLRKNKIEFDFKGSAGQSFGAFCTKGITLMLEGVANDYVGKGLSGGTLVLKSPKKSQLTLDNNVIAGNTCLYGATSGKAFINGRAGQRFAVRNSGANVVVEGTGDHLCEYMTGGIVVVLGKIGVNFAAGMSGGIAYILDEHEDVLLKSSNSELICKSINDEEDFVLVDLIKEHYEKTNSTKAKNILDNWETYKKKFKKIIPVKYNEYLVNEKIIK